MSKYDYTSITSEHDGEYKGCFKQYILPNNTDMVLIFELDLKDFYGNRSPNKYGILLKSGTEEERQFAFSHFEILSKAVGKEEIQHPDKYKDIIFNVVIKEGRLFSVDISK